MISTNTEIKKSTLLFFIILLFQLLGNAAPPNWSVNSSNFSLQKNLIIQVYKNGNLVTGAGNIIGVFVNGETRGVINENTFLAGYFFPTVYSNNGTDLLNFQIYIAAEDQVYNINETIVFNDIGTGVTHTLSTIPNTDQPISLKPFSAETQPQGSPFQTIHLPDSLIQTDNDPILWTHSGNTELTVNITNDNLTVQPPDNSWTGTETITITATEQTLNAFSASQQITYTVTAGTGAPNLGTINNQKIGLNQEFKDFNLNDALIAFGGDSLIFDHFMNKVNGSDTDQGWSINSSAFQFDMRIIAKVHYGNNFQFNSGNKLLAFIEGNLAGVAGPTLLREDFMYFLNIYSNTTNKPITFFFFDNVSKQLYPIQQTERFLSGAIIGNPARPLLLNTAPLYASIDSDGLVNVGIEEPGWVGQQSISFVAADGHQPNTNFDTSTALFEVVNENAPEISNIPDQYIATGDAFNSFDLDDFLTELDGHTVNWSVSGAINLSVNIDAQNVVTLTPINPGLIMEEELTFIATDQTTNQLSETESAIFAISNPNNPPEILAIPEQVIIQGEEFSKINLNNFLDEPEGDDIIWSYYFPQTLSNSDAPNLSVNASRFAFSMNMTAKVKVRGIYPDAGNHKLAAYHNDELRGVATPNNIAGEWIFFLTIFSNQSQDSIHFKYFHDEQQAMFAVDDSVKFVSQQIIGSINTPFEMEAGYISASKENDILCTPIIDKGWTGTDTLFVIAQEQGTTDQYADTAQIIFRVNENPVLPLDLLSFKGIRLGKKTELYWEIANPENVYGFEIERARPANSLANLEWENIGFVSFVTNQFHYDFLDAEPNLASNYYRLRMIDFDETFTYSPIIHLDFSTDDKDLISFYPNPTLGHSFFMELNTDTENFVTVEIFDGFGHHQTSINLHSDGNRMILPIDISDYPAGIYYAKIKIGERRLERVILVSGG